LIDFSYEGRKKDDVKCKRSKTVVERCRGALRRAISMDVLDDDEGKTSETNKISLSRSKPITSRSKVREIRKLNVERSDIISYPIARCKSETSVFISDEFDGCNDRQFEESLATTRSSGTYTDCNALKTQVTYKNFSNFNRDNSNSLDSVITRSECSTTSSPNSSGFCDCTESEHDALSRDDSLSSDGSLGTGHCNNNKFGETFETSSVDILFDKDKTAEERLYARSRKKNRRPLSIVRNASMSGERGKPSEHISSSSFPPFFPLVSTISVDDVFTYEREHDNYADSGVENKESKNSSPLYRRTNRYNKTQKNNQKSDCRSEQNVTGEHFVYEINEPLRSADRVCSSVAIPCDNNEMGKLDRKISIEEYVEKLSVSLRNLNCQVPRGNSYTPQGNYCTPRGRSQFPAGNSLTPPANSLNRQVWRKLAKSKSVDTSIKSKLSSLDNERRRISCYGKIRIESVL